MQDKRQNPPPMGPRGGRHGPVMKEKPKDAKKTLKRLINYIAENKYLFFLLLADMIAITLLNLAIPSIQGFAIDAVTISENRLQMDFGLFVKMLAFLILLYVVLSLFTYLQGIFSAKLSQTTVRNMRADLFSKIVRLQIRYFDTHQHGDIMSRMTNDVENISNTISQSIGSLISGGLTVIGTVAIMLWYSPFLTVISMVTIVLTLAATAVLSKPMRRLFTQQQTLLGKLNGHAEETVTGYKTIAAFGKEQKVEAEFNKISGELCKCATKAQIIGGSMGPVMNFISNFGFLLIASCGGLMALRGTITIGAIQAFLIYARQFSRPISEIANQFAQIQTAIAGAERVFEIMDAPPEMDAGQTAVSDAGVKGNIDFQHILFSYKKGEPVLKDFNLQVKAGQKIALVGATGSGKNHSGESLNAVL